MYARRYKIIMIGMMVIFVNCSNITGDWPGIENNGTEDGHLKFKIDGVKHSCYDADIKKFIIGMSDDDQIANLKAFAMYINKLKRENDKFVYDGVDKDETKHPKLQGVAASFDNDGALTLKYSYLNSRLVQGTLLFVATVGSLAGGYFFGKKWC